MGMVEGSVNGHWDRVMTGDAGEIEEIEEIDEIDEIDEIEGIK